MSFQLNRGVGSKDNTGFRGLLCSKFLLGVTAILAIAFSILSIAALDVFYKYRTSNFEKRLLSLRVGMTEREVVQILGRPELTKRVTQMSTSGELIPSDKTIIEYVYSIRSREPYVVSGIYVDDEMHLLVRLNLNRLISFTDGAWPTRQFFGFFAAYLAIIFLATSRICKKKRGAGVG